METRNLVYFWKIMSALLIMFLGLGLCMHTSSSTQVGVGSLDSDSNEVRINSFCGFKNFFMSSYLENYESLLESDFQDCVDGEISIPEKLLLEKMKCLLTVSVLRRNLIGEGSHRRLSSVIRVHLHPDSSPELPAHFCKVIVIERLPSGVFADPFELQNLHQRGAFSDAAVFGDTNLELPAFLSNQTIVEIHMDADHNILRSTETELEIKVDVPLHARYQPLDDSGYKEVEFGRPDLLVQCDVEREGRDGRWVFKPSIDGNQSAGNGVRWRIPCGRKGDTGIVSVVTFVAAFLSCLIIGVTSIFYSDAQLCHNIKQS